MNMMTIHRPGRLLPPAILLAHADRAEIEAAVDALIGQLERIGGDVDLLIAHLDKLDGDRDREPDADNESDGIGEGDQSWPECGTCAMSMVEGQFHEDAEDGHDREADNSDEERLTWPERIYQPSAMDGGLAFREHDDDELHFNQELVGGAIVSAPLNWEGGEC